MSPKAALPKKKMRFIERKLDQGMGKAVARRTYLRKVVDEKTNHERWEKWPEVADRVARGNTALVKNFKGIGKKHQEEEYQLLKKHISNASMLMSGRHLQHGDETQPSRNMEVFTTVVLLLHLLSFFTS